MDALPDSLRGPPNYGCADTWVGCDELFALVQGEDWRWTVYVPSPNLGPVEKHSGIRASNVALDTAIEVWERLHGQKVPSEFEFQKDEFMERVGR